MAKFFFARLWIETESRTIKSQKITRPIPSHLDRTSLVNNNLLLTEREGRTGEYWPEVVAVRTERSEVRTKTTEGQYSPVRLEQARLVSSLLYGTRVMLVSKLPAFENKKYTLYDHFHGNSPYGKIPTKKEPIRTPGFTPRLPCHIIKDLYYGFWENFSLGTRQVVRSGQDSSILPARVANHSARFGSTSSLTELAI